MVCFLPQEIILWWIQKTDYSGDLIDNLSIAKWYLVWNWLFLDIAIKWSHAEVYWCYLIIKFSDEFFHIQFIPFICIYNILPNNTWKSGTFEKYTLYSYSQILCTAVFVVDTLVRDFYLIFIVRTCHNYKWNIIMLSKDWI